MRAAGSINTVSRERELGNDVFRSAKSGLFNPCGWIVSINNCHKVVSKSHKDQACRIYCLHLQHNVLQTHTDCQSVAFGFDGEGQPLAPSVNPGNGQVFLRNVALPATLQVILPEVCLWVVNKQIIIVVMDLQVILKEYVNISQKSLSAESTYQPSIIVHNNLNSFPFTKSIALVVPSLEQCRFTTSDASELIKYGVFHIFPPQIFWQDAATVFHCKCVLFTGPFLWKVHF